MNWTTRDMDSSAKRTLTEEARSSLVASNAPHNDLVSSDLHAQLRNVGSRVRKSVNEGYRYVPLQRAVSVPSSPILAPQQHQGQPPPTNVIFRSAHDTLRDVLGPPGQILPPPSPRKRGRENEDDCKVDGSAEGDVDIDILGTIQGSPPDRVREMQARPTKPLRRTRRPFAESQSLPTKLFGLSKSVQPNQSPVMTPTDDNIEEDWSVQNFSPESAPQLIEVDM
ncbi:hypothetical protein JAAARDRAFT_201821 [Jaapia argillacea MUCL 33604]|uniref:Uncharacterized protein n=1 Tax=Jaapia argillacea MUCL 33604 TaxID=933084 RepID=A0A067QC24_9AGAM|nr:hypothetical protein JAAARDRAFT_201821 [Jaapia argillacea MUCL 33604]